VLRTSGKAMFFQYFGHTAFHFRKNFLPCGSLQKIVGWGLPFARQGSDIVSPIWTEVSGITSTISGSTRKQKQKFSSEKTS